MPTGKKTGNFKSYVLGFMGNKDALAQAAAYVVLAASIIFLFRFVERYLGVYQQLLIGLGSMAALTAVYKIEALKRPPWRMLVIALGGFISLRYFIWRTTETLLYTGFWDLLGMTLLYTAECYTMTIHFLGMFINIWPVKHEPVPLPEDQSLYPTVDILIPTYTEAEDIVRITAVAATQIVYPKDKIKVHILDDGGTAARRNNPATSEAAWARHLSLKRMAMDLGVNYITREDNLDAKAGNINHALKITGAELILMLDCDHVPTKDILKNTAGWFLRDKKLFLVQTPHFFINPSPVEKNLVSVGNVSAESDMFYRVIHLGLDSWNSSYFCGSAALLRRKYLEEVGGISAKSITEDAETSFLLHSSGYNSVYINRPMVCGLSPDTFDDYIIQRTRWAQGMMQLFMLNNPLFEKGLKLPQRLCYFNSCFFWLFGIPRFIFYLSPAAFLILGLKVYHASIMQIIAYTLPHILSTYLLMDFLYGKVRKPFFSEIYESVQSMFLMPAVISAILNPFKPTFKITPKGKKLESTSLNPLASTFFVVVLVNLIGIPLAIYRWISYPTYRDVTAITSAWCVYNVFLALASLGAFWETRQVRSHHRIGARGRASVFFHRMNESVEAEIQDISLTGMGFTLAPPFVLKNEEDIRIKALDGYGNTYEFPARVHRVFEKKGGEKNNSFYCGSEFVINKTNYPQIVGFVYGDSNRWLNIWETQTKAASAFILIFFFLRMGLKGCKDCVFLLGGWARDRFKGLRAPTLQTARSYYLKLGKAIAG